MLLNLLLGVAFLVVGVILMFMGTFGILVGMGKPQWGTYIGDSVWWPSRQSYPVDLPVVQLATRRVPGGQYGVRDHGGGHWCRGCSPA